MNFCQLFCLLKTSGFPQVLSENHVKNEQNVFLAKHPELSGFHCAKPYYGPSIVFFIIKFRVYMKDYFRSLNQTW